MGKKSNKNKQQKTQIVFDEDKRAKYLLGFRKRKQERKKKAREELEEKIRDEKKKHRELQAQSILDERKKAGLPTLPRFGNIEVINQNIIETEENTIVISDFCSSFGKSKNVSDEDDAEDKLKKSEIHDAEMNKSKKEIAKECSKINDRLIKLEQKKKTLEESKTKLKKNMIKSKMMSKKSKSSRKFKVKNKKIKMRDKIINKKRLN